MSKRMEEPGMEQDHGPAAGEVGQEKHDCGYLAQLSDFIDGELAPELCAELERHLADCPRCRIVVDTLQRTVSLYHDLEAEPYEIPADVEERLWQRFNLTDLLARVQEQPAGQARE